MEFPKYVTHGKCGATYRVDRAEEVVADGKDCGVCTAVKADYRNTGGAMNRSSAGTPLAEELGLVVFAGQPGPAR